MRAHFAFRAILVASAVALLRAAPLPGQFSLAPMRVTVPSPTAASLGKFGDVPVNLYTGVPDISIPLFTVKGRTLELPITLRYHASGIRVEEIGSWVGVGWTLEAGGVITRTVRGLVDEQNVGWEGYYYQGETWYDNANWPNPGSTLVKNVAAGLVDGEPDRFFFSFAGRSGQFVMGPTSISVQEHRTIPHQKLRIVPVFGGYPRISRWEITTEDGTRYTFAAWENTIDRGEVFQDAQQSNTDHWGEEYTSSWYLTEIRSPGGDVINLYYSTYPVIHQQAGYVEQFEERSPPSCVPIYKLVVTNKYETLVQRLDSIKSAYHTVRFTSTLREDALSPDGAQQEYRLDRITITTPSGTVLRSFQFEHDYFPGNRLRLKAVYEKDRNGVSLPPYTFEYDTTPLPPLDSYAQDHWGYYNGKTSNTTLLPRTIHPSTFVLYDGADRSPDPTFMKAGALKRITYPTGGYTEFVFEPHDYGEIVSSGSGVGTPNDDGPLMSAGVGVQGGQGERSTEFTVGGLEPVIATVKVGVSATATAELVPKRTYIGTGTYYEVLLPGRTYTLRVSDGGAPDGYAWITVEWRDRLPTTRKIAGGLRIAEVRTGDGLGNVTVRRYRYRVEGDTTKSSGVIMAEPRYSYVYSDPPHCSYSSRSSVSRMPLGDGPIVGYSEVTVLHGATGEYGRTRHTFRTALDAPDGPPASYWPFSPRTSYEWMRGQETGVWEYDASGKLQRRTVTTYRFRQAQADSAKSFRALSVNVFSAGVYGSTYYYHPYEVVSAWVHPEADTTYYYDETGSVAFATIKTYKYDNPAHLQVTEITETNSDGTQRITRMRYPADYPSGSGDSMVQALTAMKGSAHMHAPVIERWVVERKGTSEAVVEGELQTYRQYTDGRILPHQRFILSSPQPIQ